MDVVGHTISELKALVGPPAGASRATLAKVEAELGCSLPDDARAIAEVFAGGFIGGFRHFPWSPEDPGGAVAQTKVLRSAGMPHVAVAFGTIDGLVYFWDRSGGAGHVNSVELPHVPTPRKRARAADWVVPYYLSYAGMILDRLEWLRYQPVRAEMDGRYAAYTGKAAKKWRHRWQPHEVERIEHALRRGVTAADRFPTVEWDGRAYTDLRGVVIPPKYAPDSVNRPLVRLEGVDLSFCDAAFFGIDARNCLFRGARMGAVQGHFVDCDFTMVDVASAYREILSGEFVNCRFTGARLAECALDGTFRGCDFSGADLWSASTSTVDPHAPRRAEFSSCVWSRCRFGGDARQWDPMREGAWHPGPR